jgi:hypothetical protein
MDRESLAQRLGERKAEICGQKGGAENADCGIADCGMRGRKWGMRNADCGIGSGHRGECGLRNVNYGMWNGIHDREYLERLGSARLASASNGTSGEDLPS